MIYLDNAATTPCDEQVVSAMLPYFAQEFGNASAAYGAGRLARSAVENARRQVAALLGANTDEIYFTSGGTESDNWVLQAFTGSIVSSAIEHHAVLSRVPEENRLPVNRFGEVIVADSLQERTRLLSVMMANNETGVIQPVEEFAALAHRHGALFHTDAVQAVGHLPIRVHEMGIDFLSLSAHKFNGPKGIGALYIRNGLHPAGFMLGGAQERGRRAGTENTPAIVGLGEAARLAAEKITERTEKTAAMRDAFEQAVLARCPAAFVNGYSAKRLPGHSNFTFPGLDARALLVRLDLAGIAASAGSACTAGSPEPSHVLAAMGLTEKELRGSIRFTFGHNNTMAEALSAAETVGTFVNELTR